jgi:hypothetical protein
MKRSSMILLGAAWSLLLLLMACGGSSSSSSTTPTTGNVNAVVSDDATDDWATIGVKVLSITLTPQGGGTPVQIYGPLTSSTAPVINLVQLDQLGEIIGNASIPVDTYSQATITVSGNPSDITLTSAANPEPGFPLTTAGTTVTGTGQVCVIVNNTCGSASSTVPLNITLSPVLNVTGGSSNALDLEFDLAHPAFIVQHTPPSASGSTIWALNFNPAVRHHPIADITKLVLRHLYGTNISVSSDGSSFTMNKIFLPVPAPTTVTNSSVAASTQSLQILADNNNLNGNNGTVVWNLDASPPQRFVVTNFDLDGVASILSQPGEFVRVQARYQAGGTLVAVRVWASTSFSKVFASPEGHVLDVDPSAGTFTIVTENGNASAAIQVSSGTQFFFNNALVGEGPSVLANPGTSQPLFVRGFKVHVNWFDPTATPLVPDTVNIEIARYAGSISGANTTSGFTYTREFAGPPLGTSPDDYTINLGYISSSTPNGYDQNNNPVTGFKWWDFAQPTSTLDSGTTAIPGFVSTVNGALLSYGGSCIPPGFPAAITPAAQPAVGESYATWNDLANANEWSAQWAVLLPTPAPLAKVVMVNAGGASFTMTPLNSGTTTGCATPITVDLDTTTGQATLAYLVSRNSAGVITITSAGDLSVPANLTALDNVLSTAGTLVKVYGVPVVASGNGTIKAYVLLYFPTGTGVVLPTQ